MKNRDKQIESGSGSGSNRRMYDCDICMRGFTNPQALGGHRNLHRRERHRNLSSSSSSSSHILPFYVPLPSQPPSSSLNFANPNYNYKPPPYFPSIESNHHQTFQPPISRSYNTQHFGSSSSSSGGGRGNYAHQGEFLGLDLSLGLGPMNVDDDSHRRPPETGGSEPQEEDLDLRLGGHHYR